MTPACALALHALQNGRVGMCGYRAMPAHVAHLRGAFIPPDQSYGAVGGFTVTSGEIEDLDGKVRNLNADVVAFCDPPTPANVSLLLDWSEFFERWEGWRSQHTTLLEQSAVPILGDTEVGAAFEGFVGEYNERLRAWQARGLHTQASPDTSTESLLDKVGGYLWPAALVVGGLLVLQSGVLKGK